MSLGTIAPVMTIRDGAVVNIAGSEITTALSVVGLNFVLTNTTLSGRLGSADCATAAWTAATSIFCIGGIADPLVVTVGGVAGTTTISFTYDGGVFLFFKIYICFEANWRNTSTCC